MADLQGLRIVKDETKSATRPPNPSPPTRNVNHSHPTIKKARKPGTVLLAGVFSRFLQKNVPKSRYHLFVDDEENSETSMNELKELRLINSSGINVHLQVYGDAGSGRSLYLHL